MIFIKNILYKLINSKLLFLDKTKISLGRWNIEKCDKRINNKIDFANEDHCGPCGQYLLEKTYIRKRNKEKDIIDKIK